MFFSTYIIRIKLINGQPVKLGLSVKPECLATLGFLCLHIPNTLEFIFQYTTGTTYWNNYSNVLLLHGHKRLNDIL